MKREFKTAIDPLFLIWPISLLVLQSALYILTIPKVNKVSAVMFGALALLITVLLLAIAATRYVITEECLVVKNPLSSKSIPLSEITRWELCNRRIDLFAAATKQVEVIYGTRKLHISPVKRGEFMDLLEFCNGSILE